MAEVTLGDILKILTDQINEVKQAQDEVVEATNHKIDVIRKQGIASFTALLIILAPVIANNWVLVWQRASDFF